MEFLRFLEGLRTPFLDKFFSVVTLLGEETLFIVLGVIFFWCISKKQGYYLLSIGFIGIMLNQILKLFFRIPRPWVKDKNFTIVESARAGATGYSFPSGHTQSSVGFFGGVARFGNNKILTIISIIICVLVPLSRMYLGVHTPLDVGVSFVLALALVLILYPIIQNCFESTKKMRILFSVIILISILYLAFVNLYNFPENTDTDNLTHGIKNAYKMLGCSVGIFVCFEIDRRFINFSTNGSFVVQLLKVVLGMLPLLIIKEGLKTPLNLIFGGSFIADGLRYFILVIFVGCVWPLTFKWFNKICKNKKGC